MAGPQCLAKIEAVSLHIVNLAALLPMANPKAISIFHNNDDDHQSGFLFNRLFEVGIKDFVAECNPIILLKGRREDISSDLRSVFVGQGRKLLVRINGFAGLDENNSAPYSGRESWTFSCVREMNVCFNGFSFFKNRTVTCENCEESA